MSSPLPFSSQQQQQQHTQEETAGDSASSPTRFRRIKNVWNNHRKKRQQHFAQSNEGQQKENNDRDLLLKCVATRPSTAITKIPKLRDRTQHQPYTTNNQGERTYAINLNNVQSRDEEDDDDFYFDDHDLPLEQDLSLSKSLSSSSLSPSSSSSSSFDDYNDEEHFKNDNEEVTAKQVSMSNTTKPPHFSDRPSFEDEFIQSCQRLSKLSLQHHHAHDHQRNKEMNNQSFINSFASAEDDQEGDFITASVSSTDDPYHCNDHHEHKEFNNNNNNDFNASENLVDAEAITKEEAMKELDSLKERLQDIKERYFMYRAVQDACMEEHKIQVQQLTAQIIDAK